jgi:hypothetical protein
MSESSQHASVTKQELQQLQVQQIYSKHSSGVLEVGEFPPVKQQRAHLDLHGMTTNAVFAQEGCDDW